MASRTCQGRTKKGEPCKAAPLKDGDFCLAHADEETRESKGFGGPQEGAGRPRLPKPHERMRELVEANVVEVLRPYFNGIGLDLQEDGTVEEGEKPVKYVWAGVDEPAKEMVDVGAMIGASEKLLDRVYGRPKQQTELTGVDGGPIEHASVDPGDPETRRLAHELLLRRARPQE